MASLARRASSLSHLSISTPKTPIQAPNLIHRRNLAGAAVEWTGEMGDRAKRAMLLKRAASKARQDGASSKRQRVASTTAPQGGENLQTPVVPAAQGSPQRVVSPPPTLNLDEGVFVDVLVEEPVSSAPTAVAPSDPGVEVAIVGEVGGAPAGAAKKKATCGGFPVLTTPLAVDQALLSPTAREAFDKISLAALLKQIKGSATLMASIGKYLEQDGVLEDRVERGASKVLQAQLEAERQKAEDAEAQLAALTAQVRALDADKYRFVAQVQELGRIVEQKDTVLHQREVGLRHLSEEVEALRVQVRGAEEEKTALQAQVRALVDEKVALLAQNQELEAEKERLVIQKEESQNFGDEAALMAWESAQAQLSLAHPSIDWSWMRMDAYVEGGRLLVTEEDGEEISLPFPGPQL
ncbi:unnamed protein product [Lupinus luteus]|uniref:Uncharacterized protein n=1 Tax=Lupinus luteus TaxID=3873 RepID=A0AAV1YLS5_LUPLU